MDDIEDIGYSDTRPPNTVPVVKIRATRKSPSIQIPLITNDECCGNAKGESEGCCKPRSKNNLASPSTVDAFVPNGINSNLLDINTNDFNPSNYSIYLKTWGCSHNSSDSEYMAGILQNYGFNITDDKRGADAWILNSCTVKGPAEHHFQNEVNDGLKVGKKVIVSGCVPQADPSSKYIKGLSIIGVQQIDKVVEVVEESLQGNVVRILGKKKANGVRLGGSDLSLPKIRRNPLIEIIPVSTGCLNQCTYCKTKHARGHLASYSEEEIIARAQQAFGEGVKEIWLTSEDTGAYGIDLGTNIVSLLRKLVQVIPEGSMLRIGMTNPPYILNHLEHIAEILDHPRVYAFLHVPVQSGSDYVLGDMKREYNVEEFQKVVDVLQKRIPRVTIATDIICGFPTETEKDFQETMRLCEKNQFKALFINQFYPRKGTPAAKMQKIDTVEVKRRTKVLSDFFRSYHPYTNRVGEIYDVLVTEISSDQQHFVGHNKFYEQILVPKDPSFMGNRIRVEITSISKHSMIGLPFSKTQQFLTTFTQPKIYFIFLILTLLMTALISVY